jgi:hypothetical protein
MDLRLSGLRREVMAPRRPSSSFGLVAVSTMAMVFAVSSSLLLFSAHRHRRCHGSVPVHTQNVPRVPHAPPPAPPPPPMMRETMPPPAEQTKTCGTPVYHSNADGSQEVRYELCTRPAAE